jgi:hypothetical protein
VRELCGHQFSQVDRLAPHRQRRHGDQVMFAVGDIDEGSALMGICPRSKNKVVLLNIPFIHN